MDPASTAEFRKSISKIKDPFLRQMGWAQLWSMVEDGDLSVKEFGEAWLHELPRETDDENVVDLFKYAHSHWNLEPSILMYYPRGAAFDKWRKEADMTVSGPSWKNQSPDPTGKNNSWTASLVSHRNRIF